MKKLMEDMTETEVELRELMIRCAKGIERATHDTVEGKPLFVLVLFNDPKIAQYISNCERPSMIEAMRETADRLERREDVPR